MEPTRVALAALAIALAGTLAGCGSGSRAVERAYAAAPTPFDKDALMAVASDPARLRAYMKGRTARSFSPSHGMQVEYTTADGSAHLWYPGNAVALSGAWEVREFSGMPEVCFRYGPSSVNPVTGERGGTFRCAPAAAVILGDREAVRGDPFGLASGAVPFVLERAEAPMRALAARAGLPDPGAAPVPWRRP